MPPDDGQPGPRAPDARPLRSAYREYSVDARSSPHSRRGQALPYRPQGVGRSEIRPVLEVAPHGTVSLEMLMARIDSVNAAHGIRNTGEIGRALFAGGMLQHRFPAHDRVTMPVLVIAGRHDGVARPAGLRELASRLPNARLEEYEQSGHFVYLDEPERFARDLTRFLAVPSDRDARTPESGRSPTELPSGGRGP
jgi:pimeloyl-ACP methyl ester carboxylesterase